MCHGLPVHFAHNADYVSLFTMGLTKIPVNKKTYSVLSNKYILVCLLSILSNVTNNKIKVMLTSFQKPQASKLFSGVGLTS